MITRTHHSRNLAWLLTVAYSWPVTLVAAQAQDKPAPVAAPATAAAIKKEAKERFDRGIALFNEEDNAAALSEFKRAYELIPNQLVLFNIGLTYAGMKRPVDAVDTLDAVLAAPQGLNPTQLELATRTREDQLRRIGSVVVVTNVAPTISIDGVEVQYTTANQPLRVAQGTHVIAAAAPDRIPRTREITVAGGEQQRIELELALTDTASAQVLVSSPLRDVEISVDGKAVGKTPFEASITVEPGRHSVSASRAGYVSETRDLQLAQGGTGKLDFALREDPAAPATSYGELQLQLSEPIVDVSVDQISRGRYLRPLRLPMGPHVLRVERTGFVPTERWVEIASGKTTALPLQLTATAQTIAANRDAVSTQRTWGWVGVLGGAAIAAGGGTFAIVQQGQFKDARSAYADLAAMFVKGSGSECDMFETGNQMIAARCNQRLKAAQDKVDSHSAMRNVGLVVTGVGAAAAITGLVLVLTAGDANKYESPPTTATGASVSLLAGPGGILLSGKF